MKIFLIVLIGFFCQFFVSCSGNFTNFIEENMSDIRATMFYGENNSYIITYTCGKRESDYSYNGKHTNNIDFGLITLYPLEKNSNHKIEFSIKIDEKEFNGILEKSPYSNEYLGDLQFIVNQDSNITIKINNEELTLSCLTKNWNVNHEKAIKIASDIICDKISDNDKCEFYLKIIHDIHISKENYFWLFTYIKDNNEQQNIIIDPLSGKILFIN